MSSSRMKGGGPSPAVKVSRSYPEYRDQAHATIGVHQSRKFGRGQSTAFPSLLHRALEYAERNGCTSIISWQPHGRAFKIRDKKRFLSEVLPVCFEHQSSFNSFQRQLNSYGFLRLTKEGPDQKAYYHESFLRGRFDLCPLIGRHKVAVHSRRCRFDPSTEPDLYMMESLSTSTEDVVYETLPRLEPVAPQSSARIVSGTSTHSEAYSPQSIKSVELSANALEFKTDDCNDENGSVLSVLTFLTDATRDGASADKDCVGADNIPLNGLGDDSSMESSPTAQEGILAHGDSLSIQTQNLGNAIRIYMGAFQSKYDSLLEWQVEAEAESLSKYSCGSLAP